MKKSAGKRTQSVGRNEPCPCGSGKKYKYCCLNKNRDIPPQELDNIVERIKEISVDIPLDSIDRSEKMNFREEAKKEWENLRQYQETRSKELNGLFEHVIKVINGYEILCCRVVLVLGKAKPNFLRDRVLRDLFCEAFDCLNAAKESILAWHYSSIFPLIRRSYEIISLFVYFVIKPEEVDRWDKGSQINHSEIRDYLSQHPVGEDEESLKELYSFLSRGTHINRDFIAEKKLGEGNEFVLGSIDRPNLRIVAHNLSLLLDLWFWMMAVLLGVYNPVFIKIDPTIVKEYFEVASDAKKAAEWLSNVKIID